MKTAPLLWALALVTGALIPVQAAANAALSKTLQNNVVFAGVILFIVAAGATLIVAGLLGAGVPTWIQLRSAPWWSYIGGLIVATYVLTITYLAPRLGVGPAISLIVTGQILGALAIDQFGLMRSLTFPVTALRGLGAALMIVGAFLALRR